MTDALLYLDTMGLVHGSVSSHAVQLVAGGVAKVSLLERTVAECEPLQPPPACLYNWTSPEILLAVAGRAELVALAENDVYSLCCLLWEMVTRALPWARHPPASILRLVCRGYTLRLDRDTMPRLLFRVMREGLVWNLDERELGLGEVRDMLLMSRDIEERRLAAALQQTGRDVAGSNQTEPARAKRRTPPGDPRSNDHVLNLQPSSDLARFSKSALQSDIIKLLKKRSKQKVEAASIHPAEVDIEDGSEDSSRYFDADQSQKNENCVPKIQKSSASNKDDFLKKYKALRNENKLLLKQRNSPSFPVTSQIEQEPNNNFQGKFSSAKAYFEKKCSDEAENNLNVSSGILYKTAVTSLNVSSGGDLFKTADTSPSPAADRSTQSSSEKGRGREGAFMKLWRRNDVVTTDGATLENRCNDGEEKRPSVGFVKNAVKFYQDIDREAGNVCKKDTTVFLSPKSSPSPPSIKVVNRSVQTEQLNLTTSALPRFFAESTPIINPHQKHSKVVQTPPVTSPLSCSPLFQSRKYALNAQRKATLEDSFHCQTQTSPTVDFTNPDGRQRMFTTALSQAQITSPQSDNLSSHYQTCIDDSNVADETSDNFDFSQDQKKVTFNSSVEEISTSIVSLMTDAATRDSVQETEDNFDTVQGTEDNFDTVQETEDGYFDDDLNAATGSGQINIQLLSSASGIACSVLKFNHHGSFQVTGTLVPKTLTIQHRRSGTDGTGWSGTEWDGRSGTGAWHKTRMMKVGTQLTLI